jgi:hypothetical protein
MPYNSLVGNAISFGVMHNAFGLPETSLFASVLINRQRPDGCATVVFCPYTKLILSSVSSILTI